MTDTAEAARAVSTTAPGDDTASLLALGILAYTLESMIHEALGHGGACLAQGHRITALTPLWMRCDVTTAPIVVAGPAANVIAAALSWAALRTGLAAAVRLPLFVWLSFAFNGLVAAGYLGVGGATAFGDWAHLFVAFSPAWAWRLGAVAIAVAAYWALLHVVVKRYAAFAGADPEVFARRVRVPTIGAAIVAVAAQLYGQGLAWNGLILPLACTLVVGASLWGLRDHLPASTGGGGFRVAPNLPCVALAAAVAAAYVFVIGPGLPRA